MKLANNYWIKSGLINLLQNFSGVFFGFASFWVLVRVLSPEHYGAWTLFLSTVTIMEMIRNGLIQNALIKFMAAASSEEQKQILTASFSITGIVTFICIAACVGCARWLSHIWKTPELETMFYLYSFSFLASAVLTQFNCIEQAHLQFKGVFVTNVLRQLIFFSYILVCIVFKIPARLIWLVYMQMISIVVVTIISWFYVKPYLHFSKTFSKEWGKKLLNYGKYAFGTSVSSILSGTLDQMMLGAMLSPAASGAFNIAVRLINLIDIPTNAMATIVFPQSSRRNDADGAHAVKYLYERSVGAIIAILVPGIIFVFLFSDLVIHIIAGSRYEKSIPLLRVALLYAIFIPYGRQAGTILDSIGKTKITFIMVVITASLNIGLNYLFINSLGVMGAAWATLCSNIVGFIMAQYVLHKALQTSIINPWLYAWQFYVQFFNTYITRKIKK
ncbi:flippase [Filimonas effusa]|uniref:Flippase n=1 Tax=Filimonas effusa TaxID=2508721 RepID=A0A4V1M9N3_9BACT|nr:flippase [Filimonas effusa]RXK81810.1 flippase [Filimonas effusa]